MNTNPAYTVSCICGANEGQPCITLSGKQAAAPHKARVTAYEALEARVNTTEADAEADDDVISEVPDSEPMAVRDVSVGMRILSKDGQQARTIVSMTPRPNDDGFLVTLLDEYTGRKSKVDWAMDKMLQIITEPATAIGGEAFQFEDVNGKRPAAKKPAAKKAAKKPAATKKPAAKQIRETNTCDGCGKNRELFHPDETGSAVCTDCAARFEKTGTFTPRTMSSHSACDHPTTKAARAKCRRERAEAAKAAAAK